MKLQLEHVQMLLSNMLRLLGNVHKALEGQVLTVVETNGQLQEEQQSQLYELSSLRQIQTRENNLINKCLSSLDAFILVLRSLHHIRVQYL